MTNLLRTELGWFAGVVLAGCLVGLGLGAPVLVMLIFSAAYTVWLLVRMASIVQWLESGAASSKAPPTTGLQTKKPLPLNTCQV